MVVIEKGYTFVKEIKKEMNLEKRILALELFQQKFKGIFNKTFTPLTEEQINLRINMYDEEAEEFLKAHRTGDIVESLDAILDEIFLIIGDSVCFGVQDKLKLLTADMYWFNSPKAVTLMSLLYSEDMKHNSEKTVIDSCNNRLNRVVCKARILYGDNANEILDKGMTVVEESNMSKLGNDGEPIYNQVDSEFYDPKKAIGKILKNPKTYFEPTERLTKILKDYGIIN